MAWWFHFIESQLPSYDGINNVWKSCISDKWIIWTELSYFSWHSVNYRKTTNISAWKLPIKWSANSLYWGTPSRHTQPKFNNNIFKTCCYQRWAFSKEINLLPSLKQANKIEVIFSAFMLCLRWGSIKSLSYTKVTLHVTAEQNRSFTSVSGSKRKFKFMTIKAFWQSNQGCHSSGAAWTKCQIYMHIISQRLECASGKWSPWYTKGPCLDV